MTDILSPVSSLQDEENVLGHGSLHWMEWRDYWEKEKRREGMEEGNTTDEGSSGKFEVNLDRPLKVLFV